MNDNSSTIEVFFEKLSDLTEEVFFGFQLKENKLIYLNKSFENVWNRTREDIGSNLSLLISTIHPEDKGHVVNAFQSIQNGKRKQKLEFRIQLPDLSEKWIRLSSYLVEIGTIDTIIGIATDITADKEYSDNLHKFSNKKNSILAILSHDLTAPISNIRMTSELLEERTQTYKDATVNKLLNIILKSSTDSINLIRDLTTQEFLESSEVELVKQRADIVAKIREVIEQYQASQKVTGKIFHLLSFSKSLFVTIDEMKFMQVINNLLSNAIKFTRDNGTIMVTIEDQQQNVLIKVQDNGIGIPKDLQPFLFEKFTKARRNGIKGEPTVGLGMSIIKTIVEWHKGRIWFESKEGVGTTFYIEIPNNG